MTDWPAIVEAADRVVHEKMSEPGTICPQCGATSTLRPSGDRVCNSCGYCWAVGEITWTPPKP